MNFLFKFFARKKTGGGDLAEEKLSISHTAVTQCLAGEIPEREMLARLVAGFIVVPLAREPDRDGWDIKSWSPALVGKADGSKWVVVFTSSEGHAEFAERHNYPYALETSTVWVLDKMPPEHGLLINWGTAHQLEWSAEGIRRYQSDVIVANETEFEPENTLEEYLIKRQTGEVLEDEFLSVLLESYLYVPSLTAVGHDLSGLVPLVCYREGQSFASAFTSLRLTDPYKGMMKIIVPVRGRDMLSQVAPKFNGLVINPGYRAGAEISNKY